MWHYPNSSCYELFEHVFPLLVSDLLGIGVNQPVIILIQSIGIDVGDLGHHCSQLYVTRPLRWIERSKAIQRCKLRS